MRIHPDAKKETTIIYSMFMRSQLDPGKYPKSFAHLIHLQTRLEAFERKYQKKNKTRYLELHKAARKMWVDVRDMHPGAELVTELLLDFFYSLRPHEFKNAKIQYKVIVQLFRQYGDTNTFKQEQDTNAILADLVTATEEFFKAEALVEWQNWIVRNNRNFAGTN